MAKSSGSTRVNLSFSRGGIKISTSERGFVNAQSSKIFEYRKEIGKLTYNLSQKYGQISNALNGDTITFQKGTSDSQVRSYVKDALEGAKLYRKWDNSTSDAVDRQMDAWREKMRNK